MHVFVFVQSTTSDCNFLDKWTLMPDFGGLARSFACGFSTNAKTYAGFGLGNGNLLKDFREYDPLADTWSGIADFGGLERQYGCGRSNSSAGYNGTGDCYGDTKDYWVYGPDSIVPGVPTIVSFLPATGAAGTVVKITGRYFAAVPEENVVYFGAVRAAVTSASTSSLTVIVPAGATFKPITVTTNGLTAFSKQPFVTSFSGGGAAFDSSSFAPKKDFATGDPFSTYGVCTGDLDGDGKSELIVANNNLNYDGNTISVLRNTGSPGNVAFAEKVDFITGLTPQSVTFGDIDGDGKPDLLTSNYFDHSISILRNTSTVGSISFEPKMDFDIGTGYGRNAAINDLDGDGKPDLAIAKGGNGFSLMRNTSTAGAISFDPRIDYQIIAGAEDIDLKDMDGDSKPDIIAVFGKLSTFRNISSPGILLFESKVDFIGNSYTFDIGDLNADGRPDIVLGNATIKNNSIPGSILLGSPQSFESIGEPFSVSIGEINGDGKPDIGVAGPNDNVFAIVRNTSTDTAISFAPKTGYKSTGFTWSVAMADLDGDGKNDIATDYDLGSPIPNAVSVLRNQMQGSSCTSVTGLTVRNITDSSARVKWILPDPPAASFKVRYRPVGTTPVYRKQVNGTRNNVNLDSLLSNTMYEWQVRTNCAGDTAAWVSGPNFITTGPGLTAINTTYNSSIVAGAHHSILQVGPNPNNGNFNLQIQFPAKAKPATLSLTSSDGKKIWQQHAGIVSGFFSCNLFLENKIGPGVYILKIERSDMRAIQKIVISR